MINFTCELKDKNYKFTTTSIMKLMRFIWIGNSNDTFIITTEADKDSEFIESFKIPDKLRSFVDAIIDEEPRKVTVEWHYDDVANLGRNGFEIEVSELISRLVIMCIFANHHAMIDKINNGEVCFELEQDIYYDWNFEIIDLAKFRGGEDVRLYSPKVPMFCNLNWFITITIFRYITGRPMVVASPDAINMQHKQTPLLGTEY